MFYETPGANLFFAPNNLSQNTIYAPKDIENFLCFCGLDCHFIEVDSAPQVLTYHFDLKNKTQNTRSALIALRRKLHDEKIVERPSQKADIAISIPRKNRDIVSFRKVLIDTENLLDVGIGFNTQNELVKVNIKKAPHLLIAGATGGGKSVCLNTLLCSLLARCTPNTLRLVMVDTKKVELSAYNGIPHLLAPIATDGETAVNYAKELNRIMRERWDILNASKVRNIDDLPQKYPHILFVVDELSDLILSKKEEIEPLLISLSALGRAAGVHLVLATQRPTVNVVTGLLKANIPCRIALQTASIRDSMTILDHKGAEQLTGQGDAILKTPDKVEETRLQVAFISDKEIDKMTEWWKTNGIVA